MKINLLGRSVFLFLLLGFGLNCNGFNRNVGNIPRSENLDSLIETAISDGSFDRLIAIFEENPAKINEHLSSGTTPLILAIRKGQKDIAEFLINSGADVNLKDRSELQATPLMYAVSIKSTGFTELLLTNNASIDAVDINNDPAINWATYYGNIANMQLLIDNNADLSIESKHGTSVAVALRLWHADTVINVFRKSILYQKHSLIEEMMVQAVLNDDLEKVRKLLNKKVSPNLTDGLGIPILHITAQNGQMDIAYELLKKGAEVNQLNSVGQSALAVAARFGHDNVVQLLLRNKAEVDLSGSNYELTPAIAAAVGGNVSTMKMLVEAGADIDHVDVVNDCAPLHWGMLYGNNDLANYLIDSGADLDLEVLEGKYNAITLAQAIGNEAIIKTIEKRRRRSNAIIGSWQLVSIDYNYINKDTIIHVESEYPGRFIINESHYSIMYNPYFGTRKPFNDISNPSKDEMQYAFKTLAYNSGSYDIRENILTTHPDIARVPGFEGGNQVFEFLIENNSMQLKMFDETYPNGNKPEWHKKLEIVFNFKKE